MESKACEETNFTCIFAGTKHCIEECHNCELKSCRGCTHLYECIEEQEILEIEEEKRNMKGKQCEFLLVDLLIAGYVHNIRIVVIVFFIAVKDVYIIVMK